MYVLLYVSCALRSLFSATPGESSVGGIIRPIPSDLQLGPITVKIAAEI